MTQSGVIVGQEAPDFALPDFRGDRVKLSDYRGRRNVVLVLNRGLICPYCRRNLGRLAARYDDFKKRDTEIVAIGVDSAPAFERFWLNGEIPFVGVPDPERRALRRYGQQVKLLRLGRLPAVLIIDRAGIVRWVHYGGSMMDIPDSDALLSRIDAMEREG